MDDVDDLIDAAEVAKIIGVTSRNSVSTYQRRYPNMPRPLINLGPGNPRLWSRSAIVAWAQSRQGWRRS